MFGMSFGELLVIGLVAIIVIGPRDMPKLLRKAGRWAAKMRSMALDLRVKSGVDDLLADSDIVNDLAELRKLARGELGNLRTDLLSVRKDVDHMLEGTVPSIVGGAVIADATAAAAAAEELGPYADATHDMDGLPYHNDAMPYHGAAQHAGGHDPYAAYPYGRPLTNDAQAIERLMFREREYPSAGADDYAAIPDTVDDQPLPESAYASRALYTHGEANSAAGTTDAAAPVELASAEDSAAAPTGIVQEPS